MIDVSKMRAATAMMIAEDFGALKMLYPDGGTFAEDVNAALDELEALRKPVAISEAVVNAASAYAAHAKGGLARAVLEYAASIGGVTSAESRPFRLTPALAQLPILSACARSGLTEELTIGHLAAAIATLESERRDLLANTSPRMVVPVSPESVARLYDHVPAEVTPPPDDVSKAARAVVSAFGAYGGEFRGDGGGDLAGSLLALSSAMCGPEARAKSTAKAEALGFVLAAPPDDGRAERLTRYRCAVLSGLLAAGGSIVDALADAEKAAHAMLAAERTPS